MTDFFICLIKSPQCADKYSKTIFSIAIFLARVLMYQKRQILLPVGYKTARPKNRRMGTIVTSFQDSKPREKQISPTFTYFIINNVLLYHFVVNWWAHNKKVTKKSVFFFEAWSPEMSHNRSQSPVFGLAVLYPTGSEIWRFWYIKTRGRKIAIEKFFFAILITTLGRFNQANKKICHIHLKEWIS